MLLATTVKWIEFFAGFKEDGCRGTWECLARSVSSARKVVATSGSVSIPYVKATLNALSSSHALAKADARVVVFEKEWRWVDAAAMWLFTLSVWSSWAS
jgi:hypothetical protein